MGDTLGWDDNINLLTYFRPRGNGNLTNNVLDTQYSVPRMGKQIHTMLADVNQVNMLTEDDFEGVDTDELDTKHLRSLMQDAES